MRNIFWRYITLTFTFRTNQSLQHTRVVPHHHPPLQVLKRSLPRASMAWYYVKIWICQYSFLQNSDKRHLPPWAPRCLFRINPLGCISNCTAGEDAFTFAFLVRELKARLNQSTNRWTLRTSWSRII